MEKKKIIKRSIVTKSLRRRYKPLVRKNVLSDKKENFTKPNEEDVQIVNKGAIEVEKKGKKVKKKDIETLTVVENDSFVQPKTLND